MKLVGDVGGTKVLLALADADGALIEVRRLASADFSSFDDLLAAYLRDVAAPIDGGCLAVAGPLAGDGRSAQITNLPWRIDAPALEARYRLGRLRLANDFAAVAAGVAALPADRLLTLQAGEPVPGGLRLAIGAGTGLGVAALAGGTILASEAGHVGFSPQDETQAHIHATLLAEHGRVSAEQVISGPGLAAIHRIVAGEQATPDAIGARALAGETAVLRSVAVFFSCYGAFAGDMALAFMARGGVYLAGGVTQKLAPLLAHSAFLAAFNAKAEHAALARQMPVRLVADPEVGLIGAAVLARQTDS
jgi:glucokinase